MAHDLFISYSTKDKAVADAVCARMENGGIRCWYAPRDILPGADWASSIVDAINVSKVMVLIFTPHSNISKQVLREVDCAVSAGVTIIPLRLTREKPIESMRYYLSAVHWLDAVDAELDSSIGELYELCKAVVDTGAAAALPKESTVQKKSIWKAAIPVAAVVLILAALAVILIPKLTNKGKEQETLPPMSGTGEAKSDTMPDTVDGSVSDTTAEAADQTETEQTKSQEDTHVTGEDAPVGEKSKYSGIEPDHHVDGTTQSNIRFGGYIAYADGWYYFRSNDENKLYKMREDGSEAQKISDHTAKKIMVHDGYVYFEEEDGFVGIYRVSIDGTDEFQIYGSTVPFMGIREDKLYIIDSLDGLLALDLTQEFHEDTWGGDEVYNNREIFKDIYRCCFDGEYIYYTAFSSDGIWRASIQGGEPEQIVKSNAIDPIIAGDYLYYNDLDGQKLKAYEIGTGSVLTVVPFMIDYYQVRADGIYGIREDDGILIRYDPSTAITYELSGRQVTYVSLANERIFYYDFNKLYSTDLKGKHKITL